MMLGRAKAWCLAFLACAIATQPALARPAPQLRDGVYHAALNGVVQWYRIAGARNHTVPLVIIHGGPGGNTYSFEHGIGPSIERFATVVYYDQRGSGHSQAPKDDHAYGVDTLVADIEALRRRIGAGRIDLLGYSFGGELALEYAVAHPDRVDRLIAQSPSDGDWCRIAAYQAHGFAVLAAGARRTALEALAAAPCDGDPFARESAIWGDASRADVDRFLFHDPARAAAMHRLDAHGAENTGKMAAQVMRESVKRAPLLDRASGVRAKTLIMIGAYDRNVGVDMARELADAIPHARFVVLGQSGHFPNFEEPARYTALVRQFLE
jgi:proline iminopeptidase